MAIRQMINVDPDSVMNMSKKVNILMQELRETSKKLQSEMEVLYQSGTRDAKFDELKNVMSSNYGNINNLINFMDKYQSYLKGQADDITRYLNTTKLK